MASWHERRTQSRKRPVSLVYVELPPANGGMMRDLSEYGFSLRAMMPLQSSEKVAFSFLLDSSARIDGDAIVVRLEDRGHVAALEFAGLSAHARDQIRQWLDKYDESLTKESAKLMAPPVANSTFEQLRTEIRSTEARPDDPRLPLPGAVSAEVGSPQQQEISPSEPPRLLKLSSIRPQAVSIVGEEPEPPEVEAEAVRSAALPLVPAKPPSGTETPRPVAASAPPMIAAAPTSASAERSRNLPPALEPLSSLEAEAGTGRPGWMESFTLTRAVGIMLLLTLVAGSLVYHRELGHALVWLGQMIAGEEPPESTQSTIPPAAAAPAPAPTTAEVAPAPSAEPVVTPPVPATSSADSSSSKSSELPGALETTPPPQVKDSASSALVPLTQVTRPPAAGSAIEAPAESGQQEYQRAQAILHAPSRNGELPEAIRLLWSAVEKGNVAAEITLAELYRLGRGVSKNCAQARVLLATAARKGSPDAQRRLEALEREGCEE